MKRNPPAPASAAPLSGPSAAGLPEALGDDLAPAWRAAFCLLAVLLFVLLWFPVARIPAHYTVTINEGINSYYEHVTASGGKVYGHPPR